MIYKIMEYNREHHLPIVTPFDHGARLQDKAKQKLNEL